VRVSLTVLTDDFPSRGSEPAEGTFFRAAALRVAMVTFNEPDVPFALTPAASAGLPSDQAAEPILAEGGGRLSQAREYVAEHRNVGRTEQIVRLTAGAALVGAAAFAPLSRGWRIALGTLGATQLLTGSMNYCPLWQALGVNTCSQSDRLGER
jgi:hypothetical protein